MFSLVLCPPSRSARLNSNARRATTAGCCCCSPPPPPKNAALRRLPPRRHRRAARAHARAPHGRAAPRRRWLVRFLLSIRASCGCRFRFRGAAVVDGPRPLARSWAPAPRAENHRRCCRVRRNGRGVAADAKAVAGRANGRRAWRRDRAAALDHRFAAAAAAAAAVGRTTTTTRQLTPPQPRPQPRRGGPGAPPQAHQGRRHHHPGHVVHARVGLVEPAPAPRVHRAAHHGHQRGGRGWRPPLRRFRNRSRRRRVRVRSFVGRARRRSVVSVVVAVAGACAR